MGREPSPDWWADADTRDANDYSSGPQGGAVLWIAIVLAMAGLFGLAVAGALRLGWWLVCLVLHG